VEEEDGQDEEEGEEASGEQHDEKEVRLVRANLLQLKVFQFIGEFLQAIGKVFRRARLVVHVVLDAVTDSDAV